MQNTNNAQNQLPYDPRWFIWTIVFLVATGVGLVTFIVTSDSSAYEIQPLNPSRHAQNGR